MTVRLFSAFDPASLKEVSVRPTDNNGRRVLIAHTAESIQVHLQTSKLRAPSGIKCWENNDATKSFNLELALSPADAEYKILEAFDNRIIDMAFENKAKWFPNKKTASRDVLKELYTHSLRIPIDKNTGEVSDRWPPTFRVKIPHSNGALECEMWDAKKTRLDAAEFLRTGGGRNAVMTVIVQCTNVWISGSGFGASWKARQILVHSTASSSLGSFAFLGADTLLEEAAKEAAKEAEECELLEDSE